MRSSIFTQVWIPFIVITLAFVSLLWFYYPEKQEQLISRYKNDELSHLAKTLAIGVEISLDRDDYTGLEKSITFLQAGSTSDFAAVIFTDSTTVAEDTILVRPEGLNLHQTLNDNSQHVVVKAPFKSNLSSGYVLLGIHKEVFQGEIQKLNRPILITLLIIAIVFLTITYFIAIRISKPIQRVTEFANLLNKGNYQAILRSRNANAFELRSLQDSLSSLGKTLDSQRKTNNELTANLEEQVKQKTESLQLAFNDLNTAQEIAQFANFSYDTKDDTWKGSNNLIPLLGLLPSEDNTFQPLLQCIRNIDLPKLDQKVRTAIKETQRFEIQLQWTRPIDHKTIWLDCVAYIFIGTNRKAIIRG